MLLGMRLRYLTQVHSLFRCIVIFPVESNNERGSHRRRNVCLDYICVICANVVAYQSAKQFLRVLEIRENTGGKPFSDLIDVRAGCRLPCKGIKLTPLFVCVGREADKSTSVCWGGSSFVAW